MENCFKTVKDIITMNIEVIKKIDPKKSKNIESFFEQVAQIPLIKLYTKEGIQDVEDILYNTDGDFQSEVLEFLLRIKPDISTIDDFEYLCQSFLEDDNILNKMYVSNDNKDGEFTKIHKDNVKNYYVLNLILAYNTAI